MKAFRSRSTSEQLADHLRGEVLRGAFGATMPGIKKLVLEEVPHLVAALQFCGQRGIRVPEDLSLVCMEHRTELDHCWPAVTHLRWDRALMARRIARWADRVARGCGKMIPLGAFMLMSAEAG